MSINKKDYEKISSLEVINLTTFGHNGLDWVHSLLDGHPEILIMPAFSFFRSLDRLKLRSTKFNDIYKLSSEEISKEITKLFYYEKGYNYQRRKFIFSNKQKKLFEKNLKSFLTFSNVNKTNLIKSIFYGIHFAFCNIHKVDLKYKKIIVIQEHVPWHSFKYAETFNSRFLLVMRDPRAAICGSFVGHNKIFKRMNALQFDFVIFWWTFANFFKKKNFKNKKVLGVHWRGTDYKVTPGHPFPPTKKQVFYLVDHLLKKEKIDKIFLVTEEIKYLNLFRKKYKDKLCYYNSYRVNSRHNFGDYPRKLHRYKLGLELFIEVIILSNLSYFIYCDSNISDGVIFLSKNKNYKNYMINNGKNSKSIVYSLFLWHFKNILPESLGGFKTKVI